MGDEFLEIKRKKERGLSNKEFLEKVSEAMKDYDAIVVVGLSPKDEIITWRTTDSSLLAIGLVETAKKSIMREQEE